MSNSKRVVKSTNAVKTAPTSRFNKSGVPVSNAKVTQSNVFSAVVYDRNNVKNALVFSTQLDKNSGNSVRDAVRAAFVKATGVNVAQTNVCRLSFYATKHGEVAI